MVELPKEKKIHSRYEYRKPPFFLKRAKLTRNGFRFPSFTEFDIKDGLATFDEYFFCLFRIACMNDLYIVYTSVHKENIYIIFRKNLTFYKSFADVPENLIKTFPLSETEFTNAEDYAFYRFVRLAESKTVEIYLKSRIQKILLNNDQVIMMLNTLILIYTPFSTSIINEVAIDIALDRYLYILTKDKILIYDEKLINSIDIDKPCNFIIPAKDSIFIVSGGNIYKLYKKTGDQSNEYTFEFYFDCFAAVTSCAFDENYMYLFINNKALYKIGLYEKKLFACMQLALPSSKISVNNDFVLLNSRSSNVLIKKDDFSVFSLRNLSGGLNWASLYKNYILYMLYDQVVLFEYKIEDNKILPVDIENRHHNNTQNTRDMLSIEKETQIFTEDDFDNKHSQSTADDYVYKRERSDKTPERTVSEEMNEKLCKENEKQYEHPGFDLMNHQIKLLEKLGNANDADTKKLKDDLKNEKMNDLVCSKLNETMNRIDVCDEEVLKSFHARCLPEPDSIIVDQIKQINDERFDEINTEIPCVNKAECKEKQYSYLDGLMIKNISDVPYVKSAFNIVNPEEYYGATFYNQKSDKFDKLLQFNEKMKKNVDKHQLNELFDTSYHEDAIDNLINDVTDNPINCLQPVNTPVQEIEVSQLNDILPSPLTTVRDPYTQKSQDVNLVKSSLDDMNTATKTQNSQINFADSRFEKFCTRRFKKIKKFIKKHNLNISESESSNESIIQYKESTPRYNPLVKLVKNSKYHTKRSQQIKNTISAFEFSKHVQKHNLITYNSQLDALDTQNNMRLRFAIQKRCYSVSRFFTKSFMEFYEKYQTETEENEIPFKYQVYDFINEEFRKVVGYKQNTSQNIPTQSKIEIKKKKGGGF